MLNEWLAENKDRIEVFSLPSPYSPDLNPQAYVNQDVKTNIIGKRQPINKAQMRTNVEDFMNGRKQDRKLVQKYFHVCHVRYATYRIYKSRLTKRLIFIYKILNILVITNHLIYLRSKISNPIKLI